jgi:uncharacterized protein YecT (DUF1311 family)
VKFIRSKIQVYGLGLFCIVTITSQNAVAQETLSNWLENCYQTMDARTMLSDLECQAGYIEKLKAAQTEQLKRIQSLLSRKGPAGTNYAAAVSALETSQQAWQKYMTADCNMTDQIFGLGNALAQAGAECRIQHLQERNRVLSEHERMLSL